MLGIDAIKTDLRPRREQEPCLAITGRAEGLVAFVLSLFGLTPTIRFLIVGNEVRCESNGLFSRSFHSIPTKCVSVVTGGFSRPVKMLILAAVIILPGVAITIMTRDFSSSAFSIPVGFVFIVLYLYSTVFYLSVFSNGGPPIVLVFTGKIDVNRALELVAIIRDRILVDGETTGPAASSGRNRPRDYEEAEYETGAWASPEAESDEAAATELFEKARRFVQDGDRDRAVATLQEIVRRYPGTEIAEQARRLLQRRGH